MSFFDNMLNFYQSSPQQYSKSQLLSFPSQQLFYVEPIRTTFTLPQNIYFQILLSLNVGQIQNSLELNFLPFKNTIYFRNNKNNINTMESQLYQLDKQCQNDCPGTTESQIINHLSSSIEDLLFKITQVTHDYQPRQDETRNATRKEERKTEERKEQSGLRESISTQSRSKGSKEQKENFNDLEESPFLNPQKQKDWEHHHYPRQPHWNSLKVIHDQPIQLHKVQSLFHGIKEVAESTILQQHGQGNCNRLQNAIPTLKASMFTGPIPETLEIYESPLKLSDFQLGQTVGSGKFGDVYLCRHKATGCLFALKKIFKSVIRDYGMESQFALELKLLYVLDHPNIVKLYGHFQDEYHVFLLMEYLQGGELVQRLNSHEQFVSRVLSQMIEAVEYMHGQGVVHRDIKPENIVVCFGNTVKLVDFGWAGRFDQINMKSTFCGTLDYVSPEMKDKGQYSSQVDLWSLGVLTYELITGQAPFKEEIAHWKRRGGQRSQHWDWCLIYPPTVSGLSQSFMRNLLKENPDERASLRYCKNHFFIRKHRESIGSEFQWTL